MAGLMRWALTWLGRGLTVLCFLSLLSVPVTLARRDWSGAVSGALVTLVVSGLAWLLFWLTRMLEPYYPE